MKIFDNDFQKTWIFRCFKKEVVINKREKKNQFNVESAFLKYDMVIYKVEFRTERY